MKYHGLDEKHPQANWSLTTKATALDCINGQSGHTPPNSMHESQQVPWALKDKKNKVRKPCAFTLILKR